MIRRAAFYANRTVQILEVRGAGADHPWLAHVPGVALPQIGVLPGLLNSAEITADRW